LIGRLGLLLETLVDWLVAFIAEETVSEMTGMIADETTAWSSRNETSSDNALA
jgi:hypothetical protein